MKFAIPACNMNALTAQLDHLNKRAEKLGLAPVKYTVLDRFEKTHLGGYNGHDVISDGIYQNIEIEGETPVIKGWVLDAAVEYLDEGKEVVKSLNWEFKCPTHYRGVKPFCEHCNTHKVKRYTMILRNVETGEYKMVGKTCLKDFLGDDVELIVRRYNWLVEIINELEDPESKLYSGGGGVPYYSVDTILEYAAYFTLEEGYKPASFYLSTKSIVMDVLFDPRKHFSVGDEAVKYAAKVKKWVMEQDANNDFMMNVQNLIDLEYVTERMIGYIVGAIGAYNKDRQRKAEKREILNEHFGEVKKRYTMDLTLIKVTSFEGYYGTTWVHTFVDADNRCFVWFGSKCLRNPDNTFVEDGSTVKVKATVKDHGEYRGTLQTNITRVTPVK